MLCVVESPELHSLRYLHVLHVLIVEAAARGLLVLLDMHVRANAPHAKSCADMNMPT